MLWIEAVPELEAAKARVATLMQTTPCEYLIFSQKTGHKISINPTDVYGNSQSTCVARPFIRGGLCHTPVAKLCSGDYVRNLWEQGTVTTLRTDSNGDDFVSIRWDDGGLGFTADASQRILP